MEAETMAPRAYWKGHVRLSLVSFPVQLVPAIDTREKVTFHRVHRKTGERVRYQPVVPDHGPVPNEEIAKGYEYEKDRFVIVEPDEIEKLQLESTHTIDVLQFVDAHEIDAIYYEKPYFMLPDGKFAEEAFRVVRDAMRQEKKVAIGQVVLSQRERIAAFRPCGRGMLLETLRYDDEVREANLYFADIGEGAAAGEQLELAKQLIKMKAAPFDPEKFKDHYQTALRQLVAAKLQGREPQGAPEEAAPKVINLMDALRRSLKPDAGAAAAAAAPANEDNKEARGKPAGKPARTRKPKPAAPADTAPRRKKTA
jgi:DNA end-binding protein Ku